MADDVITCPQGHQVEVSAIRVADGQRVCPRCEELGTWRKPGLTWSRRLLAAPLAVVALAFLLGGISSIVRLIEFKHEDAPGLLLTSVGFGLAADCVSVLAAAWIAVVLYRAR
ncbi:MAG: hypothetical protein QOG53_1866 [Frankiales bacterium]|jgi:hypothetical protein|nr:hypothetical protein [Frankiales bacterium]